MEYYSLLRTMDYQTIQHHGILGQKWGVRRYQNADGSLTPAGKLRYGKMTKERTGFLEKTYSTKLGEYSGVGRTKKHAKADAARKALADKSADMSDHQREKLQKMVDKDQKLIDKRTRSSDRLYEKRIAKIDRRLELSGGYGEARRRAAVEKRMETRLRDIRQSEINSGVDYLESRTVKNTIVSSIVVGAWASAVGNTVGYRLSNDYARRQAVEDAARHEMMGSRNNKRRAY